MINNPLIISGKEYLSDAFQATTLFYPQYTWQVANASLLEVASAIGSARRADRMQLSRARECLHRAASVFSFTDEDVEHTVRVTGMPISLVSSLFAEIPGILNQVAEEQWNRFQRLAGVAPFLVENIGEVYQKSLVPLEGFCYAITPGNDPRASALLAANLGFLGIPFILRASIRDAAAPLVIRALLAGGFDPAFCQLLYSNRADPQADQKHYKILDASAIVWTFGPNEIVDRKLRYEITSRTPLLDLSGYPLQAATPELLRTFLSGRNPRELEERLRIEERRTDHFTGKLVLRHNAGNCAAVACGSFDEAIRLNLYASLGYATSCTATRSIMLVDAQDWISRAAQYLAELVVDDPLDPATQVGYIDPGCLDYLSDLVTKNRLRINTYGGTRLSPVQSTPLLVASQEEVPDFFGQEIPAYVLAIRECSDLSEAVDEVNRYAGVDIDRLAVSLFHLPSDQRLATANRIKAHIVLVDLPTTTLLPFIHEGNDYALTLTRSRLLINVV